jgi:hypothetical protein
MSFEASFQSTGMIALGMVHMLTKLLYNLFTEIRSALSGLVMSYPKSLEIIVPVGGDKKERIGTLKI